MRPLQPRPSHRLRATVRGLAIAAVLAVAATVGSSSIAAAAGTRTPAVKAVQELATLVKPHRAVSTLQPHPSRVTAVPASRPITGAPTVLPVIGHVNARNGVHWLRVMLPGRPNGSKGWIAQHGTVITTTRWRISVNTASRRVLVFYDGHRVRTFGAVVGKPSTPTPHGQFFVEESVRMPPGSVGAPFALALSARSLVFQEFEGGPGQIAMHGIANLGGSMGTAVSHGCIRLSNRSVSWLAARVPPGVVVTITQ
jgi:lipoprotein-anchoring transpeptidase ErfK/SrfK